MQQTRNPNVVPVGSGGTLGHIGRMIVMVFTGGFVYPNTFVEGMDLTAIQKETEGSLYERKERTSPSSNAGNAAKSKQTQEASAIA